MRELYLLETPSLMPRGAKLYCVEPAHEASMFATQNVDTDASRNPAWDQSQAPRLPFQPHHLLDAMIFAD